jgi:hypothetical protein
MIFNSLFHPLTVILIALGLCAVLVYFEWKRSFPFRIPRCLAQTVMILALAALILRPALHKTIATNEVIILTPHFNAAQRDSLTRAYPQAILQQNEGAQAGSDITTLPAHALSGASPRIRFVLGDGLPPHVLGAMPDARYTFLPANIPNGVQGLRFSRRTVVHQTITLTGTLGNTYGGTRMILEGPGGTEDSVSLKNTDTSPFALTFTPKQAGRFLYRFIVKNEEGSIVDNIPMPIEVRGERKLNILVLQEFPTAEVRYLKNFLADQGHRLTLRYQLSRNIFRYESANTTPAKVTRVDSKLLQGYDLLLLDSDVWQHLPGVERQQIETAQHTGLGVIVLFNGTAVRNTSLQALRVPEFAPLQHDTVHLTLVGQTLPLRTLARYIPPQDGFQPLLQSGNRSLSGYTFNGFGKTGFQLLNETYRFAAEGKPKLYAALWNPLIEQTARVRQQPSRLKVITPEPIYPNEPIDIEILAEGITPTLLADSIPIPLTEDVAIDGRYLGRVWFGETGWHSLAVAQDSTAQSGLYLHDATQWQAARVIYQHQQNKLHTGNTVTNGKTVDTQEPVSPWIFFTLFLLSAGFLWLSVKL